MFKKIDLNNDGSLSRQELRDAFKDVPGIKASRVEEVIDQLDKDGDGDINLEEFIETCMFNGTVEDSDMILKLISHYADIIKKEE